MSGVAVGVITLVASAAIAPATASRSVDQATARYEACSSNDPCLKGKNADAGPGVEGVGTGSNGVVGETFANGSRSMAGISGIDRATTSTKNDGVRGFSSSGSGVYGNAPSGIGVRGSTVSGNAVVGYGSQNTAIFGETRGYASSGVLGLDAGSTSTGSGMTAYSDTGNGITAYNFQRGKYFNTGVLGISFLSSISTAVPARPSGGIFNSDTGEGVVALTNARDTEALTAANFGGGPVMRGYASQTEVLEVSNGGDLVIAGSLTQHGVPRTIARTTDAKDVLMYAPAQTSATVEDVGEAQLSLGQTYVRVDPHFAATMASRPYMVFLTPQGDTPGLYVTDKSRAGFSVREHGGHSNIVFDYKIVAGRYGEDGARLAPAPRLGARAFSGSRTVRAADLRDRRESRVGT